MQLYHPIDKPQNLPRRLCDLALFISICSKLKGSSRNIKDQNAPILEERPVNSSVLAEKFEVILIDV